MRLLSIILASLLFALPLAAEGPSASAPDDELDDLLAILDEETEIATKTRMNSDFVPGIVTVLDGEELEALGVRNAWEAMSTIPGVQAVLDEIGRPSVIVRGVPFPFNSGNIHILVNGVPLSREAAGINGTVLFIPIEQIERIEFIRGPGSVLYGDFAFQGLANIVTRRNGFRADLTGDSEESWGGAIVWGSPEGPRRVSANVAHLTSDNAIVPNDRPAETERTTAFVGARFGEFSLVAQAIDHDVDQAGPSPGPPLDNIETSVAFEARWDREVSDQLRLHGHLNHLDNDLETVGSVFDGHKWELGFELGWNGWENQQWLTALEYSDGKIDYAASRRPSMPGQPQPPLVPIGVGETRRVVSAIVQDQIQLGESFSLTLGARYDDSSDTGDRVTPRLSAVWRIAENHILKAQYAEGFRGPTFFELYRAPNQPPLDFEVNKTTEINYVYRRPKMTGRVTLFRSRIRDMIFIGQPGFDNEAAAEADGLEVEWSQRLGSLFRIEANASWVDSKDSRNPGRVLVDSDVAAPWMSNLALFFSPTRDWIVSTRWNHVADRDAGVDDDAYDIVDVTLTKKDLFVDGLAFRIGVQNAFDDEVIYFVPLPVGSIAARYGERVWWARVTWTR